MFNNSKDMKKIKIFPVLLSAVLMVSCNREDSTSHDTSDLNNVATTSDVNNFIWKGLNLWYYWQSEVPALADNQYNPSAFSQRNSDKFFYSLLYNYPKTDRFSWIVSDVDELIKGFSGISKSSGMDYSLFLKEAGKSDVIGIVNYVVKDSPADNVGIKRGDLITGVNGTALTTQNYTILRNEQFQVTITKSSTGISTQKSIVARVIEENPIAFQKTYSINGKKIGYLVFNGFQANYNDELNTAFAKLKQEGATELILDLRYNGGGSVTTAVALGQMITGQFTNKPFVITEYNSKLAKERLNKTYNLQEKVSIYNSNSEKIGEQNINSLHLNRLYVLTSGSTASASELTIDGLRAYIPVTTIGAETYGKFVGSNTLFDSPNHYYVSYENRNKKHKWAMQPITFAYYNANRTPHPANGNGIAPNYSISPSEYLNNLGEFGDFSDIGLRKALELITGNSSFSKVAPTNNKISLPKSEFLASTKTLKKLGTEVYTNPKED